MCVIPDLWVTREEKTLHITCRSIAGDCFCKLFRSDSVLIFNFATSSSSYYLKIGWCGSCRYIDYTSSNDELQPRNWNRGNKTQK